MMINDTTVPYRSINDTARLTGLSRDYIRRGVRSGAIPAIRVGTGSNARYMVDFTRFLARLRDMSDRKGCKL